MLIKGQTKAYYKDTRPGMSLAYVLKRHVP
jgi:hypothetical protein